MKQWAIERKTFTDGEFDEITSINPFTRRSFTEGEAREWVASRVSHGAYTPETIRVVCAEHGPWEPADQARSMDSAEDIIRFEAERWISRAEIAEVDVSSSDIAADSALMLARAGLLVPAADQPVQYVRPSREEIGKAVYESGKHIAPGSDGIGELTDAVVAIFPVKTEGQVWSEAADEVIRDITRRLRAVDALTPQVRGVLADVERIADDVAEVAISEET